MDGYLFVFFLSFFFLCFDFPASVLCFVCRPIDLFICLGFCLGLGFYLFVVVTEEEEDDDDDIVGFNIF